jgi:hypothetical protein
LSARFPSCVFPVSISTTVLKVHFAARLSAALSLAMLVASAPAHAQSTGRGEPDASRARVRFGRLMLNPTIGLTNLGVDTNVFNEPDQNTPKSDFTATVTPQTDLWLRMGRSWLIGNVKEDLVWYKEFASERSTNHAVKAGWMLPLNRLTFAADTTYRNTRERPGFEIDARAKRTELLTRASLELRAAENLHRHPWRSDGHQLRRHREFRRLQSARSAEPHGVE